MPEMPEEELNEMTKIISYLYASDEDQLSTVNLTVSLTEMSINQVLEIRLIAIQVVSCEGIQCPL